VVQRKTPNPRENSEHSVFCGSTQKCVALGENTFHSVCGPSSWSRTESLLFAECLQFPQKQRKLAKNEQKEFTFCSRRVVIQKNRNVCCFFACSGRCRGDCKHSANSKDYVRFRYLGLETRENGVQGIGFGTRVLRGDVAARPGRFCLCLLAFFSLLFVLVYWCRC